MKNRLLERLKQRDGFSRLQNLMILILTVVLVTIVAYVFTGYRRAAYQVKADRMAQRIYESAQTYISGETASGDMTEWNQRAGGFGGIVTMEEQEESLRSRYEGRDFEAYMEEYRKKYRNVPVYYILLESRERAGEDRRNNPVTDMLEYQLLDENVTRNTVLIEYNGNTGEVLCVLYSEKTDTFTYEGDREGKENVIIRDKKSLNSKWQGYYGVALEDL